MTPKFSLGSASVPCGWFSPMKPGTLHGGRRAGIPTEMVGKMKALERENRELRKASACFAMAEFDRRSK